MDEEAADAAMVSFRRGVGRNPEARARKHKPLLEAKSGGPWVKDVLRVLAGHEKTAC